MTNRERIDINEFFSPEAKSTISGITDSGTVADNR